MLEYKDTEQNTDREEAFDEQIDTKLAPVVLDTKEKEIAHSIVVAEDKEELQKQFDLFNLNQAKKNALRIIKLESLMGKVEDQLIDRVEKRPDLMSTKDILEIMNTVSGQVDRSQKTIDSLKDRPMITAVQKNDITVNVGTDALDRDSKERVIDAITKLLKQAQQPQIIDVAPIEIKPEPVIIEPEMEENSINSCIINSEDIQSED